MDVAYLQGYIKAAAIVAADDVAQAEHLLSAVSPIPWRTIHKMDRKTLRQAGIILKKYA